ncbi:hypothetical protein Tco_1514820 [Tanacetum coccineum]
MYYPRFTKVIIHYFLTQDKTLFWRNTIGMHTSKDDYLKYTLRFISAREETQIYGAILPESLTSPEMKEIKAYKTYLGFSIGATPPKKAVKRPAKKSTQAPARGVVIRETLEMPVSKKKEKVDVARGKGIELLSDVPLTKEAQYKEVRKKSLRDFHKTHLSGSGTATKATPSAAIIKPYVTNKGTGVKPRVPDMTESDSEHETGENESESKYDQDVNNEDEDDEEEVKDELVKTPSNNSDDEDETKITDKAEGDEDEEIDYTISLLYDDVDIRLNEPVDTDKGFVQEEGTDAAMTNVQQGYENPKISQVIEDAHVTLSTVLVSSSSHSSDLAAKFLNFLDIPTTEAEIVSPMDVQVHHKVPSKQTPTLLTVHVLVITDSSPVFSTIIPQPLPSFIPPPQLSTPTPPPTTKAKNSPSTLPNFASVVKESLKDVVLAKESSQPQSSYEAVATLAEFELKKILIDKINKSESYLAAPEHRECYEGLKKSYDLDKTFFSTYDKTYSLKRSRKDKDKDEDPFAGSDRGLKKRKTSKDAEPTKGLKAKDSQSGLSKGTKSQPKSSGKSVQSEEPEFEIADLDMPQDQEENLGPAFNVLKGTRSNYAELEYDFEECYKALLEKLDWENPEGGIKDMVPNIWVPVKATYDKHALQRNLTLERSTNSGRSNEETWVWVSEGDCSDTKCRLVPSCFVIFDLEPLSLSFDFVFMSEIFKSLSFSLDHLCHLAILCLDQHAYTLHHIESLLTIFP